MFPILMKYVFFGHHGDQLNDSTPDKTGMQIVWVLFLKALALELAWPPRKFYD